MLFASGHLVVITIPVASGLFASSRVVSVLDSGAEGPGSNRSHNAIG